MHKQVGGWRPPLDDVSRDPDAPPTAPADLDSTLDSTLDSALDSTMGSSSAQGLSARGSAGWKLGGGGGGGGYRSSGSRPGGGFSCQGAALGQASEFMLRSSELLPSALAEDEPTAAAAAADDGGDLTSSAGAVSGVTFSEGEGVGAGVGAGSGKELPSALGPMPFDLACLVAAMWHADPGKRPTARQVTPHRARTTSNWCHTHI